MAKAKKDFKEENVAEMFIGKETSSKEEVKPEGRTIMKGNIIENKLKSTGKKAEPEESNQLPLFDEMPMTLEEAKKSGKVNVQTKDRRVNLTMQQAVYEKADKAAKKKGLSLNSYMSYLVKNAND